MISLICGTEKNDTNEFIYKTETESQIQKTNLWLPEKWRIYWEIRINIYTPLYIK